MNDVIQLIGPGIFLAAPIIYAAIGGLFTQRAGIFNIALEGFMLLSAYFSIFGVLASGSLWIGTLIGIGAAVVAAIVMAVVVVGFGADEVIVGIAINLLALGLTTFLLADAQRNGTRLDLPSGYPLLHIRALDGIPVLDAMFNNRDPLVWLLIPVLMAVMYVMRRTTFGLQLKAAGEAPLAARAAGVRVVRVRFLSIVISGFFSGIGGALLAIGSVHLFSENMTSGRGTVAFAAVIFGAGLVSRVMLACLLFGFAQALAGLLQIRTNFPPQFVLMVPFLLTIIAVTVGDALSKGRLLVRRKTNPAPLAAAEAASTPVTVLGHLTIDDIRFSDGRELVATIGGGAAYASLGAFVAGGDADVVARVGADYPVERLGLEHPDGGLIDARHVISVPGRSIHNVAWYAGTGERHFDIEDFAVLVDQTPRPGDISDLPLAGRWVLVAPAPFDQQDQLIDEARRAGAHIALDTELHYFPKDQAREGLQELAKRVDCFLPSREHLRQLFGTPSDALTDLAGLIGEFACPLVVVKCGADGVIVGDQSAGTYVHVPAVPDVSVVDPTGAGDSFNGGFLAGLSRGETPTEAAMTGCVAASFVIESIGVEVPKAFSGNERTRRYEFLSPQVLSASTQTQEREKVIS